MKDGIVRKACVSAIGIGTVATAIMVLEPRVEGSGMNCCGADNCRIIALDRLCFTEQCPGGGFEECCFGSPLCSWSS
jgi:hypothetical protein